MEKSKVSSGNSGGANTIDAKPQTSFNINNLALDEKKKSKSKEETPNISDVMELLSSEVGEKKSKKKLKAVKIDVNLIESSEKKKSKKTIIRKKTKIKKRDNILSDDDLF